MTNSTTEDQDRIVVVAVVQWEIQGQTGKNTSTTSKLRVRNRDIKNGSSVCTGQNLLEFVSRSFKTKWIQDPKEEECWNLQVDVYDATKSCYIALQTDEKNTMGQDIVKRFGSRLKLIARLTHKQSSLAENPNVKAIMGRFYSYDESEGLEIAGQTIRVHENSNQHNAGTGVNLWDGALLLAQYLEKQPHLVKEKRVLELGAGVGLVGLAAGVLGASEILMTDLPYILPNMRENVHRNSDLLKRSGCEKAVCGTCDWCDPPTLEELGAMMVDNHATTTTETAKPWTPDIILVADCVWMQELVAPLLATMQQLTTRTEQFASRPEVVISYQRRGKSTDEEFWAGLSAFNATVNEIDVSSVGLTKPDSIYLLSVK